MAARYAGKQAKKHLAGAQKKHMGTETDDPTKNKRSELVYMVQG